MAHLPRAVHLVAHAPVLHVVRLFVTVRSAQVTPLGAFVHVAVLDVGYGHFRRASAQVKSEQRFGVDQLAPVDEFVRPELVGLERIPGPLQYRRPFVFRADAVQPIVTGDEVPARISHDRHVETFHFGHHILAEPFGICELRSRLVNAGVNGPPEVFQKGAQETSIQSRLDTLSN